MAFLAGGTDGEQLTEMLMEKEEECRRKEKSLAMTQEQLHIAVEQGNRLERERQALQVQCIHQLYIIYLYAYGSLQFH